MSPDRCADRRFCLDLVQLADQIESAEKRAEVLAAPKQMLEQEEGMTILRIED